MPRSGEDEVGADGRFGALDATNRDHFFAGVGGAGHVVGAGGRLEALEATICVNFFAGERMPRHGERRIRGRGAASAPPQERVLTG